MTKKNKIFDELCSQVHECFKCPRMKNSTRVLNHSSGSLNAPIMFIGEAPGRLGADGSGIPFHGDKAGHNFEGLLEFVGLNRTDIFVTNSVLCNPKDNNGNNSPPNKQEILNCSKFLYQQIKIINPKIVVTLGGIALNATKFVEPHDYSLKPHVRTAKKWFGRILIPLYHPGQRAMIHRSYANQRSDYQFVAEQLKRLNKTVRPVYGQPKTAIIEVLNLMLDTKPSLSYFSLHKLFYLIEYNHVKKKGFRLTNAFFIRQKDGPYCTDLHLFKLKKATSNFSIKTNNGGLRIVRKQKDIFNYMEEKPIKTPEHAKQIIQEVMKKYGNSNDAHLKQCVYLTSPMKQILRIEKKQKINIYNFPIDFKILPKK